MATKIPYVRKMEFDYGRVAQVSPLIRRVIARNPGPFTFHGTGTYIVGEGRVAVIDPGPLIDDHIEALKAAVAGETVTHILITHTHADHSPAAEPFKKAVGAPTYGFGPHTAGRFWTKNCAVGTDGGDRGFVPDRILRHGDVVSGPGWTIEAVHTPGHCANHLCFALKEESALFSGDQVMGWSTTVVSPPGGDMKDYMDSLRDLLTRNDKVYWPTHGPVITDPKRHVAAMIAHREEREVEIAKALTDGLNTIPAIVARLYADVPEKLHPAAARTVLSHLVHMIETGRVACDGVPTPTSTFSLRR
jgi:glyoxylase-like metal-dependent hydrolase (beta-lactamase superfamily II)